MSPHGCEGSLIAVPGATTNMRHRHFAPKSTRGFQVTGVRVALTGLREAGSMTDLLSAATRELCHGCGFDRAVLFRVEGSTIIAENAHSTSHGAWAENLVIATRAHPIELGQGRVETRMIRRREAVVIHDAPNHPRTIKPLVGLAGLTSYVAAPVVCEGCVVGLLHADCHPSHRRLRAQERDALWTFAEGFAYALEGMNLRERVRVQRSQARTMTASLDAYVSALGEPHNDPAAWEEMTRGASPSAEVISLAPESRIAELLTRREREVLELMAQGATNTAIASDFVISEATVKSHVKSILRKLGAANRAEAVSRYLLALQSRSGRVLGRRQSDPGPRENAAAVWSRPA